MDLSKECHKSLYFRNMKESSKYYLLYLSKSPDREISPLYRFNFSEGHLKTNQYGYSRFYAQVSKRVAHELNLLKNRLCEVAEKYIYSNINKHSYIASTEISTIEMHDLIIDGTFINFPINTRSKYRIQTQHQPFQSQEIHLDTVREITSFKGSIVLSIPWIKYYSSNTFEPYAVVGDLLITDIIDYSNPHYTPEFFSQVIVPDNLAWMQHIVNINQNITQQY
jgi:hypothetical protein